jgi:starvation-inducible outer membrane lipoprotein
MTLKHAVYILGIFFIMLVMGCAAGISQQSRSKVTYTGSFSALQKTPDVYKGEVIILGGRIIETKASSPLSELTVLQLALGSSGRPENLDQSEGRFIVQTNQLLDPAIYQKDMLLTVVGTLKGVRFNLLVVSNTPIPLWNSLRSSFGQRECKSDRLSILASVWEPHFKNISVLK